MAARPSPLGSSRGPSGPRLPSLAIISAVSSIQIIRLLDVVPPTGLSEAVGVFPRSIVIRGEDFRGAETVLINGTEAPEFVILNSTTIMAQVPEAFRESAIYEVNILSGSITFTEQSLVEFTVGRRPQAAKGKVKLMQTFLRILMRSTGTNLFHRTLGGSLRKKVGGNISQLTPADVQLAVTNTANQIIAAQSRSRNIPSSERLLAAEIVGLDVSPQETATAVTIVLTSHSRERMGTSFVA